MLAVKLIFHSILRQRGIFLIWIISLAFAVSGLLIIDVYRTSLSETLRSEGAKLLTGHVALSARRLLTEEERAQFRELWTDARFSQLVEMFAMVSTEKESRLGFLRFIDDSFPLLGGLKVREGSESRDRTGAELSAAPEAWVASDLLSLMDIEVGDELKVGKQTFVIRGVIETDPSQTFRFGNMAPRIYLHRKHLNATELVQYGSTFSEVNFAAFAGEVPPDLKTVVEKKLPDTSLRVTVPTDLDQGPLRVMSQLLDYLGLVALVTLSLGWVGVYYLGRRWLMLEQAAGGLLKALGWTAAQLRWHWILKLTLILGLGVISGGVLAWLASNLAEPWLRQGLPEGFTLTWSWRNSLLLFLVGPIVGWFLLIESLSRLAETAPLQLIAGLRGPRRVSIWTLISLLGLALLAVLLTFLQARSWKVTGTFLVSMIGSVGFVVTLSALALSALSRVKHERLSLLWHLCLSLWTRRKAIAILLITVSAMTGLLSQLIPHLEKTIVGEITSPPDVERPGLFLFDVQDEQFEPLREFLSRHQIRISQSSPFIRARLLQVNGTDFERAELNAFSTREEENDARMRNRGVNLTYRPTLGPAEKVIRGKDFAEMSVEPAEISVEERYARRLNLNLGDQILFDVQGVEVKATIANLRTVDWDSFQPNFFMQLKPGVIDEAPKTWILTLAPHPELNPGEIQRLIAKDFPNVTSINVEEAVHTIAGMVRKLGAGLRIASRLSLGLGLFVFVMILLFQLVSSERDWIQLHRQGMEFKDILRLQVMAYGLLSLGGVILGSSLSLIVCWVLAEKAFASLPRFDWLSLIQIFACTWIMGLFALIWLSRLQFRQTQFKSRFDAL